MIRKMLCLLTLLCLVGCDLDEQWTYVPGNPPEVPPANLPVKMRPHNWVSKQPNSYGQGSCAVASSVYHFRWHGQEKVADLIRRKYAGGQTASSITKIWRTEGIPYVAVPTLGDPDFLEWASRTRRGAIIWYFPSHCVHFCGYAMHEGQEVALLNDNNREHYFIRIPKREFLANWRGYGGFACTTLLSPAPTLPTIGYTVQK